MLKQYVVSKYVLAENAQDALKKAKKTPVSQVFVDNTWLDKEKNGNFFHTPPNQMGFKK